MPRTPDRSPDAAVLSEAIKDMRPDDIDSEWLDEMVKRLFKELQRQLARVEATKPDDGDTKTASVRTANVRTLSAIERTLERLARMEQQRVASRKVRTMARNDELRVEIEQRLDKLLTYRGATPVSEDPEP